MRAAALAISMTVIAAVAACGASGPKTLSVDSRATVIYLNGIDKPDVSDSEAQVVISADWGGVDQLTFDRGGAEPDCLAHLLLDGEEGEAIISTSSQPGGEQTGGDEDILTAEINGQKGIVTVFACRALVITGS